MPFEKGHKLAKGRAKGSKNTKTQEWEDIGLYLSKYGADKYVELLKEADGKEYMERFEKILEYFKPKLARQELTGKEGKDIKIVLTNYANTTDIPSPPVSVQDNGCAG